jgi:hypothetical protein
MTVKIVLKVACGSENWSKSRLRHAHRRKLTNEEKEGWNRNSDAAF